MDLIFNIAVWGLVLLIGSYILFFDED